MKMRWCNYVWLLVLTSCWQSPPLIGRQIVAEVGPSQLFADVLGVLAKARWQSMAEAEGAPLAGQDERQLSWSAFKDIVLQDMISTRLLLLAAEDTGLDIGFDAVEGEYQKLAQHWHNDDFEAYLHDRDINTPLLLSRLRETLLGQKYIQHVLQQQAHFSEAEINEVLVAQPTLGDQEEEVRLLHVVLAERKQAQALLLQLRAGLNFIEAATAFTNSWGPLTSNDAGSFPCRVLPQALATTCAELAPNQVSSVIETEYGFHVMKILDKQPAKNLGLADKRVLAQRYLLARKERLLKPQLLTSLRTSYTVRIKNNVLAAL